MSHLDEEQLLRLTLGTLPAAALAEAAAHVSACTECHARQQSLAAAVFAKTVAAPISSVAPGVPTQPDRPAAKAADPASSLARGTALGRYVLLERLGAGGMGEVFAAYDPQLDRKVALKLLRGASPSADARARLTREAQAMARLQHPNVVAVHDVGTFGDRVFIAMEFIDGETLTDWLRGDRSWKDVVRLFLQAGSGLGAAHRAGLIHRDFKPDNVLIGTDGRPRVLDFGLARQAVTPAASAVGPTAAPPLTAAVGALPAAERPHSLEIAGDSWAAPVAKATDTPGSSPVLAAQLTLEGAVMGTPGYMAPEQLAGLPTDARSDQFSFCVALYEALYGRRPFNGPTLQHVADAINNGPLPPPPPNSPVPPYVFGVVKRGLAPNPADRFADMQALLATLRPRRQRSWRTVATMAALALVSVAGVGYALWSAQRLRVCGGAELRLADVWDTATKEKLRAAFEHSGSPLAADAWKTTMRTLDTWSLEWVNASREACEASRLRKIDSPALYEMKTACLDGRLQRLRALTHLFEDADRDIVAHASAAAASLDPVADCFNLQALSEKTQFDETARAAGTVLTARTTEARALFDAGKYARGVDVLRTAVTGDTPPRVQAEALLWLGRLLLKNGQPSEAREANVQAAAQALRANDPKLEAIAFSRLHANEGFDDTEPSDAETWSHLAHAAASVAAQDWEVAYELSLNDALVALRRRKLNEALRQFERALALVEEHRGVSHPDVASMHDNLGVTFSAAGDFAAAIEQFDRSYALHVSLEGADHPNTAMAEANLAFALRNVGRFREAIGHDEHSLSVRRATLGENHPETLKSFENLAKDYLLADRRDEALGLLQHSLEVRTTLFGPLSREVAQTLDLLVDVYQANGAWKEAHATATRELDIMRAVAGPESLGVATALVTMGTLDTHLGHWAEAKGHLVEALRVRRAKVGESGETATVYDALGDLALAMGSAGEAVDAFNRALAIHEKAGHTAAVSADLVGLGRAALLVNQPATAVKALERALALHGTGEDPKALAVTRLELGRALWFTSPEAQPRARELLTQALLSMSEPTRSQTQAALARRGLVIVLNDGVDAGL